MPAPKYKAIFLDFYGTIAAGDVEAVERLCVRIVRELNLNIGPRQLAVSWGDRFFRTMDACHGNGFRTLRQCECDSLVETCAPLCGTFDPTPFVEELFQYMCAPPLHPEVIDVIADIDRPICCVSNADDDHLTAAIAHHNLSFTEVVSSENARSYKPNPAIFHRALRAINLTPSQVLHVGDSLHSDIAGGRQAGIDTVWVCRDRRMHDVGSEQPTHKISSLKELQQILQ